MAQRALRHVQRQQLRAGSIHDRAQLTTARSAPPGSKPCVSYRGASQDVAVSARARTARPPAQAAFGAAWAVPGVRQTKAPEPGGLRGWRGRASVVSRLCRGHIGAVRETLGLKPIRLTTARVAATRPVARAGVSQDKRLPSRAGIPSIAAYREEPSQDRHGVARRGITREKRPVPTLGRQGPTMGNDSRAGAWPMGCRP